jgi:diaminopropionate ammonia-lyase
MIKSNRSAGCAQAAARHKPAATGTAIARINDIAGNYNRFTITTKATVSAFVPDRSAGAGRGLFSADEYQQVEAFFTARPQLAPTPLRDLPALAASLNLAGLKVKDETARFGLNAFKLLGAQFAITTLQAEGSLPPGGTVVCASEGNHGRAVARAARTAQCHARVYMAADAAQARVDAIAGEGATVIRVDGSYDDAVRMLGAEAAAKGWTIVSDTSWDNYERIPRLIMLGYTRMLAEVTAGHDLVFVQGGVGGLLCGVASWCAYHAPSTKVISVEPTSAACLQASARAGRPTAVTGKLSTAMAGLRNREVSPLAFDSVKSTVAAFLAIDDVWALEAMRALAVPTGNDPSVPAGASGSAALGGLLAVCRDPGMAAVRERLNVTPDSRVLVIVSEGITDPDLWQTVTGRQVIERP